MDQILNYVKPKCLTQVDNMQQAYEMAIEALGLSITTMEEAGEKIPEASVPGKLRVEDGFLVVIEFDLMEYRRKQ